MDERSGVPPGAYEKLVTVGLGKRLRLLAGSLEAQVAELRNDAEVPSHLARHLADEMTRYLKDLLVGADAQAGNDAAAAVNEVLRLLESRNPRLVELDDHVAQPLSILRAVRSTVVGSPQYPQPLIPLSQSALLVNDDLKLSAGTVIKREIASADRVDLICAFVNHHGVRILEKEICDLIARGGEMRLITTTYMGATQKRALDLLSGWGVRIKIVYEMPPVNTKLHAKAWLFFRNSAFHTATIGSSNLSHAALMDGLEWNVRLTQVDSPNVLDSVRATFERYWADPSFEDYDPARDGARLQGALKVGGGAGSDSDRLEFFLDVEPWPHQKEILEALEVERERHHKSRNLVVAATGTGKTIVAALDYKRLRDARGEMSLLFVAHRREILDQARSAFRHVLRDGSFGERWVDGDRPSEWRHVFASIQTLANADLTGLPPDKFRMVVVDEFHHAEARTYRRLLDHVHPEILLGLTATPERADGVNVADLFDGATIEIRLWDALDRGLLCPFQYFGVADDTDLRDLRWERGHYLSDDLDHIYVTNGDARARIVAEQVRRIVTDVGAMRALGFCASVSHARFMARKFTQFGIASACLAADTPAEERDRVRLQLQRGEIRCIFSVDLFNEGVDLPEIDTVLFLRPTESATVYIQQLGRGLRLCANKPCLTVLDFIGQQHRRFRFDLRYRAMTGFGRADLKKQIENGFPALPAGCHIQLDRESQQAIVRNIEEQIPARTDRMVAELKDLARDNPAITVGEFLAATEIGVDDLYRNGRSFTMLRRQAQILHGPATELERRMGRHIDRLLAVDDRERLAFYGRLLREESPPDIDSLSVRERRLLYMLVYDLLLDFNRPALPDAIGRLWPEAYVRKEVADLLEYIDSTSRTLDHALGVAALGNVPLRVHASYTRDQIMAAFELNNPASVREGVRWFETQRCDVLLVTLRKSEREFSPTTRYNDYVVSPTVVHWESQSPTRAASPTGQRYINHAREGSTVLLFMRESKNAAYCCLGPARYMSHESERPMRILWKLDLPAPAALYQTLKAAAG